LKISRFRIPKKAEENGEEDDLRKGPFTGQKRERLKEMRNACGVLSRRGVAGFIRKRGGKLKKKERAQT